MEFLQEVQAWRTEGRTLIIEAGWEGHIHLTPALPGVLECRLVRGTPWSREGASPSLTIDPTDWPASDAPTVEDYGDYLLAAFPDVLVKVDKSPLRLHYWAAATTNPITVPEGAPLLSDSPTGGFGMDGWQVGVRFALSEADHFFGLGEPDQRKGSIPFNHKGKRFPIWHKHLPAPSRLVLPVVINHKGYGLFIDNPWAAEWDMGTDGQTWGYTAMAGQVTYYFIAGPELTTVVDRLTKLTGRPAMPPKWTFGLMQSKFGYRNRTEVEELATAFNERNIPVDTIILDLYWFKKMGDLAFDKAAFPKPEEMIANLKAQGIKVIVIEEPYVVEGSRLFPEGDRLGLFGKQPDGTTYTYPFWAGRTALVDFTQALAKQWWADEHKPLMDLGIAGWWTDLNEPEEQPPDMVMQGGVAPQVRNVYSLHMQKAVHLAYEQHQPEARPFIMSRAAWPGSQALGVGIWSGDVNADWGALANQIPLGLNTGLTGLVSWNTDIGGFNGGKPSPELYVRWMQFGAFNPIMRPHGAHSEREPWVYGEAAERIATEYIKLRYRLLPYTYTLAREANLTGLPFMRPLVLHYPQDSRTINLHDQFLWGRDLLVAPVVTEGATERKVYLPAGEWYDFWTNRKLKGGRFITAKAPLETMPMFVRAGAIIPMAPDRLRTGGAWEELTLAIYPEDGLTAYDLYEDDGESTAYQRDVFALTRFTCAPEDGGFTVTVGATQGGYAGQPAERRYNLALRMGRRPSSVAVETEYVESEQLTPRRSGESLAKSANGWWYDQKLKVLHVKMSPVSNTTDLRVGIR